MAYPQGAQKIGKPQGEGGSAAAFSPDDLANLSSWFKNNTGVTTTGTGVSQWTDQSGNGNHLTQGTDASRPTDNGTTGITFNGTSDFITDNHVLDQPYSVYMLVRMDTYSAGKYWMDGNGNGDQGVLRYYYAGPSPTVEWYGAGAAEHGTDTSVSVGTFARYAVYMNGSSSLWRIDDGADSSTVTVGAGAPNGITLGAKQTEDNWAAITVKELIVYTGTQTSANRDSVMDYLDTI